MTYETVVQITQPAMLILFVVLFLGVVIYAFWPGNKARFDRAARIPLDSGNRNQDSGSD
jgi:cytochrome c oxidase cbb3-type subunit 4